MTYKSDAIIVREAQEIIEVLPVEVQNNPQFQDSILISLQQGQSALEVRTKALELAYAVLGKKVDKGFELVDKEFKKVDTRISGISSEVQELRHQAEIDRVHAEYAKQAAQEARTAANQALEKIADVKTTASDADAKAESAQKMATTYGGGFSNWILCAFVGIAGLTLIYLGVRLSAQGNQRYDNSSYGVCGIDIECSRKQK